MTSDAFHEYETAVMILKADLTEWFPGVAVHPTQAGVPIYAEYDQRDAQANEQCDVSMVVVTNRARSSTLAIVPVALYERGAIIASLAFAGPLAKHLRTDVLEVLVLRRREPGEVWVCLGSRPLPTGRFPTLKLRDVLSEILLK